MDIGAYFTTLQYALMTATFIAIALIFLVHVLWKRRRKGRKLGL